jgi:hypothetical protein
MSEDAKVEVVTASRIAPEWSKITMSDDRELYNIVVIGAMNPRIHSPAWYSQYKLISEDEFKAATLSPGTMLTAQVAQFRFKEMTMLCLPDRWEIKTTRRSDADRIVTITQRIFDDLLMHTPVVAVGFNFIYSKKTDATNVARLLASRLVQLPFGLTGWAADSGEFSIRRFPNSGSNGLAIGPSPEADSPSHVSISINYEYRLVEEGQFKLEEKVFPKYPADRADAEHQSMLVLQAINEMSE